MKFILSACPIHQACTVQVVFGESSGRHAPWPDPDLKPIADREFPGLALIEADHLWKRPSVVYQASRQPVPWGRGYFRPIFREQPEDDSPRRLVLLQVDQQLAEGPRLRVTPEGADRVGTVEVGEHEDVEELGAGSRPEGVEA
jgi:hypothetical protein